MIRSAAVRSILHECMQQSNNLYAECLLRLLKAPAASASPGEELLRHRRQPWEEQGPSVAMVDTATARVAQGDTVIRHCHWLSLTVIPQRFTQ